MSCAKPASRLRIPERKRIWWIREICFGIPFSARQDGFLRNADAVQTGCSIKSKVDGMEDRDNDRSIRSFRQGVQWFIDALHSKEVLSSANSMDMAIWIRTEKKVILLDGKIVLMTPL